MNKSDKTAAKMVEIHNRIAGRTVKQILMEVRMAGGEWCDAMTIAETILAGVISGVQQTYHVQPDVDELPFRMRRRLKMVGLADLEPKGRA